MTLLTTQFICPGPVAAAYLDDVTTPYQCINGPIGSGKTTTSMFKMFRLPGLSAPIWRDGRIRCRWLVVRETYDRLQKNTLASWFKWFPKDRGFSGGNGRPGEYNVTLQVQRHGEWWPMDLQFQFVAIGEQSIEDILRGYEPTFVWLNEMDLQQEATLEHAWGRTGRYPTEADIMPGERPAPRILVADMNAPQDPETWSYKRFFEGAVEVAPGVYDSPTPGHRLYRQPGGLDPRAENLQVLGADYYRNAVASARDPLYVRRMIHNETGYTRDGQPVYVTYDDDAHVASAPLGFDPRLDVWIGMDQGLHPALVAGQCTPEGVWRIVAELLPGRIGLTGWCAMVNEFLDAHGIRHRIAGAYCDPAGFRGGVSETGDVAWTEAVSAATGLDLQEAPSNEIQARIDAVAHALWVDRQERVPGLRLCPEGCKMLRRGFVAYYRYKRTHHVTGSRDYDDKPLKRGNPYADVHDALQYMMLGAVGLDGMVRGVRAPQRFASYGGGFHVPKMAWSPMDRRRR